MSSRSKHQHNRNRKGRGAHSQEQGSGSSSNDRLQQQQSLEDVRLSIHASEGENKSGDVILPAHTSVLTSTPSITSSGHAEPMDITPAPSTNMDNIINALTTEPVEVVDSEVGNLFTGAPGLYAPHEETTFQPGYTEEIADPASMLGIKVIDTAYMPPDSDDPLLAALDPAVTAAAGSTMEPADLYQPTKTPPSQHASKTPKTTSQQRPFPQISVSRDLQLSGIPGAEKILRRALRKRRKRERERQLGINVYASRGCVSVPSSPVASAAIGGPITGPSPNLGMSALASAITDDEDEGDGLIKRRLYHKNEGSLTNADNVASKNEPYQVRVSWKWEFLRLCLPSIIVEYAWTIGELLVMPYLLDLGVPVQYANLIWLANPIFGIFIQPVVGRLTDNCTSKWGRRRPFLFGLLLMVALGYIVLISAPALTRTVLPLESGSAGSEEDLIMHGHKSADLSASRLLVPASYVGLTFLGYAIADMAIDLLQIPGRALMNDMVVPSDRPRGNVLFSAAGGFGRLFAFSLISVPLRFYPHFIVRLFAPTAVELSSMGVNPAEYHTIKQLEGLPGAAGAALHIRVYFTMASFFVFCLLLVILSVHEVPLQPEDLAKSSQSEAEDEAECRRKQKLREREKRKRKRRTKSTARGVRAIATLWSRVKNMVWPSPQQGEHQGSDSEQERLTPADIEAGVASETSLLLKTARKRKDGVVVPSTYGSLDDSSIEDVTVDVDEDEDDEDDDEEEDDEFLYRDDKDESKQVADLPSDDTEDSLFEATKNELKALLTTFRTLPPLLVRVWIQTTIMWYTYLVLCFWWTTFCAKEVLRSSNLRDGVPLGTLGQGAGSVSVVIFGTFLLNKLNARYGPRVVLHVGCAAFSVVILLLLFVPGACNPVCSVVAFGLFGCMYPIMQANPFLIAAKYFGPDYGSVLTECMNDPEGHAIPLLSNEFLESPNLGVKTEKSSAPAPPALSAHPTAEDRGRSLLRRATEVLNQPLAANTLPATERSSQTPELIELSNPVQQQMPLSMPPPNPSALPEINIGTTTPHASVVTPSLQPTTLPLVSMVRSWSVNAVPNEPKSAPVSADQNAVATQAIATISGAPDFILTHSDIEDFEAAQAATAARLADLEAAKEAKQRRIEELEQLLSESEVTETEHEVERLVEVARAKQEDEAFGQVAALMTMSLTMAQIIMGALAGSVTILLGSISNAFIAAALFMLIAQLVILSIDLKTWNLDDRVALGLAIRRHQRRVRSEEIARSFEQARRIREQLHKRLMAEREESRLYA